MSSGAANRYDDKQTRVPITAVAVTASRLRGRGDSASEAPVSATGSYAAESLNAGLAGEEHEALSGQRGVSRPPKNRTLPATVTANEPCRGLIGDFAIGAQVDNDADNAVPDRLTSV